MHLLAIDPDLGRGIPAEEQPTARRLLVVPRLDIPTGTWEPPPPPSWAVTGRAVSVVRGLLARNARLGDRTATQLLGPGDVFDPWSSLDELLPCEITWYAHEPTSLAGLDERYAAATRRWPQIALAVQERLSHRTDRLAAQAVALQLPNVEQRVIAILWQLADRFGRVAPDGVVIPLRLSHQILGQLVGAQRPTVTLAMGKLADAGLLVRRPDGSWFLATASQDVLALSSASAAG